jgi:hypothetical protein
MLTHSAATTGTSTATCILSAIAQLKQQGCESPQFLMVQASALHDLAEIGRQVAAAWPACVVHAATSCLGSMTDAGTYLDGDAPAVCLFAITDPDGDYGSCGVGIDGPVRDAAMRATQAALWSAGRPGEAPEVVWLSATPGREEQVLEGIQSVVGTSVAIVGGSAADNAIAGNWRILADGSAVGDGLIVSVMFPATKSANAFHSGYTPTERTGTVTDASARTILTIDHRPAAEVYAEWTEGKICAPESGARNILMESALAPIGRTIGDLAGAPIYLLSHPETTSREGGVTLFTDIQRGDVCTVMHGTMDSLIRRPLDVARAACDSREIPARDIRGIIFVFCAGCMLAVHARIDEVRQSIADNFPGVPFIVAFTFGEQGSVLPGFNRHGNLMISAVVLS